MMIIEPPRRTGTGAIKIERKDMKKTVNEIAQSLRKCADLMEHDTEFQAEFAEGMSESQIMYMCILIAQKIAK